MAPLPLFLRLGGRKVILVGGGRVALQKLRPLEMAGAAVTVVAPEVAPELGTRRVAIVQRPFMPSDLDGAWLAVAAATPEVNRQVAAAAEARRVFVNAVDDLEAASAWAGASLRRGDVTVAFSTGGRAPALAGLLREAIDALLPEDLEEWVELAAALRSDWRGRHVPMAERRPLLLEALNRLYARAPAPASGRPRPAEEASPGAAVGGVP